MTELRKVDNSNLWDIVSLQVAPGQERFVASNTHSILEAYACNASGGTALPFGIYADDRPVGFVMIGFDCKDWPDAPAVAHGSYSIWRLMIDARYQRQGLGKQALEAALAYIRTWPCGRAVHCWLSYEPDNDTARRLYHRFGFRETGEMDGAEIIAVLPLANEEKEHTHMNYEIPGFTLKQLTFDHKQEMMKLHDDVLAALPNASWYFPSDEWEFDAWLKGQEAWGYFDGDKLAGFAVITPWQARFGHSYAQVLGVPHENTFDFHDVLVLPQYRGRGIHTMFLRMFTDLAKAAGGVAIYSTVDPENSASWYNFEKAGYEVVCVRPAYDGRQRRYYKLTLA